MGWTEVASDIELPNICILMEANYTALEFSPAITKRSNIMLQSSTTISILMLAPFKDHGGAFAVRLLLLGL